MFFFVFTTLKKIKKMKYFQFSGQTKVLIWFSGKFADPFTREANNALNTWCTDSWAPTHTHTHKRKEADASLKN